MAYFNLPFSVRVSNNNPIDGDRYVVDNISARNNLITTNRAFEGLQVYVKSEQEIYILKSLSPVVWETFSDSAGANAWNGLQQTDSSIGLGGSLNQNTTINTGGHSLTVTGGMNIYGTLTVDGSVAYANVVDLNVSDNIITVNYGQTGSGVSKGFAGIRVDRGSADDYMFVFRESDDTFRIGIANEASLPGDTQAVATRQDSPISTGVPYWNNTTNRFDTHTGFTYVSGTGLSIPGTLGIRASVAGAAATQIPVFTADPASTTRVIGTRTPAQLRSDIGAGTVTSVDSGNGLTGGPITGSGTLSVVYADAVPQPPGTPAIGTSNRVARMDHVHASDNTDTVTRVGAPTMRTGDITLVGGTNMTITESPTRTFTFAAASAPADYALSGTTNQINVSGSPRVLGSATTLSLPQDIHTSATPRFLRLGVGAPGLNTRVLYVEVPGNSTGNLIGMEIFSPGPNTQGLLIHNSSNTGLGSYLIQTSSGIGLLPFQVMTDGFVKMRAESTSTAATQIPVFIENPAANTGAAIVSRTPAQLRSDIGAGTGTVTSVAAGSGMDFTTITSGGSVNLGTPGTLTSATSNGVTATSHTHAITTQNAGSTTTGILRNNGSTRAAGHLYGGTTDPTSTTRLNYDGNFHAQDIFGRSIYARGASSTTNPALAVPKGSAPATYWKFYSPTAADSLYLADDSTLRFLFVNNGNFQASGDVIAYSTMPSDIRLKEDLQKLENPLEKILSLEGVSYRRKGKDERHLGFIAQEVEKVIPEVVKETTLLGEEEDVLYKTIRYNEIIPYLTEAIKEQQQMINELRQEIEALKRK